MRDAEQCEIKTYNSPNPFEHRTHVARKEPAAQTLRHFVVDLNRFVQVLTV